jgi:hypothetical protein
MPFCRPHHDQFHELVRIARVDLTYTADTFVRMIWALKICLVAVFMCVEGLENAYHRRNLGKESKEVHE